MKLDGVSDGRLYGSDGRTVFAETADGRVVPESRLPAPPSLSQRVLTAGPGRRLVESVVGRYLTTNVWRVGPDRALASVGRAVFATDDGGDTWTHRLALPDSSGLRGLLPAGVCVHGDRIYLGEYPLAEDATPRIRRSDDGGRTWETALELPDVRHVHAVQVDPYGDDVWVTTGDADDQCRIGRLRDDDFEVVLAGAQRYRAVELAFAPTAVLWGVDCAYRPSNELLRLDRDELATDDPTPTVVGTVESSVYHAATLAVDGDTWVAFATAGEVGGDRTAPADAVETDRRGPRVVAASSATDFTTWHDIRSFSHTRRLADWPGFDRVLPRSNAYVFLAAHPERGLLVNPYNARPGDGTVIEVPPDRFRALRAASDPDVPERRRRH